ncbi:MAG: gamma-glutamyl-gamma-aminobutyrate hydrolase family protein [Candidatus Omnitrophica bacterium]|nr:gamma-glutamyl-gamma-aminobutyrate hydrolase family protein [Candidatus Omnitrophota bacterium]
MKVLVFRHIAHEGLGTLEAFLKRSNVSIEYRDLFRSDAVRESPQGYDFVISMGGPMNVDETERYPFLLCERKLILKAVQTGIPVLGICLGAQMIARALGAPVYRGSQKEIGWYPIELSREAEQDPVFGTLEDRRPVVFQWHGDTFDLPQGAVRLASSDLYPNQAFRFGHSYGLQFHIEMTREMILDWCSKGEDELRSRGLLISKETVRQEIENYESRLRSLSDHIYAEFFTKLVSKVR